MKKLAFFVEGQTERIFLERLLSEYLGFQSIEIMSQQSLGSKGVKIIGQRKNPNASFFILIFDSGGDGSVISAIKERAEHMISTSGYSYLIAMHDLFPRPRERKREVIEAFNKIFNGFLFSQQIKFVLAVMEIEAWFIADYSVFGRIDKSLTYDVINKKLSLDLIHKNPEDYDHPSMVLDKILMLIGKRYKKKEKDSYFITSKLDYVFLCSSEKLMETVRSWKYFLDCLNSCIEY